VHAFPLAQGKSLSVICSVLQWLKDAEARDVDGGGSSAEQEDGALRIEVVLILTGGLLSAINVAT